MNIFGKVLMIGVLWVVEMDFEVMVCCILIKLVVQYLKERMKFKFSMILMMDQIGFLKLEMFVFGQVWKWDFVIMEFFRFCQLLMWLRLMMVNGVRVVMMMKNCRILLQMVVDRLFRVMQDKMMRLVIRSVIYIGQFSRVLMMVVSRYRFILVMSSCVMVKEIVLIRCVVLLKCLCMNFGMEWILELQQNGIIMMFRKIMVGMVLIQKQCMVWKLYFMLFVDILMIFIVLRFVEMNVRLVI